MTEAYLAPLTIPESIGMLRNHPSQRPATVPDTELGIAALLLLLTVVLAVVLVPGLGLCVALLMDHGGTPARRCRARNRTRR